VTTVRCLKAFAHLLAINEPSEPGGRMGPAAAAIEREHIAARVNLLLADYRRLLLRQRCGTFPRNSSVVRWRRVTGKK